MHWIIISPMIYNVKRIYICLSDIFKLFHDFFKRNSGNRSSPHKFPHNPTLYDKTPHKEEKYILLLKTLSLSRRARRRWSPLLNILQHKNLYFTSFNTLCKLLSGILDVRLRCCETSDRNAIRRAAYIIQADFVAELDG